MTDDTPTDDRSTNPDDYSDDVAAALVAASQASVSWNHVAMTKSQRHRRFEQAAWDELEARDSMDADTMIAVSDTVRAYSTPDQMLEKAAELEQ